jgi:hypothetical protein
MVDKLIRFTFETDAQHGVTAPKIKIQDQIFEIKEGINCLTVEIEDCESLIIDFFSKSESDTVVDGSEIVKDTQFKINKIWVDGILTEPWFKNIAVYHPMYFDGFLSQFPDSPKEIVSPYQFNFPGLIKWQWSGNFWDWYFIEKNNREIINFLDKDPDRVWKFRGSVDPCDDLVEKLKKLLHI